MDTVALVTPTTTETVSGIYLDLANPNPDDIIINDIAWALSRQARYAGHTMSRIPYTVAQHTVQVSRYVEQALTPGHELYEALANAIDKKIHQLIQKDASDSNTELNKWMEFQDQHSNIHECHVEAYAFHGLMHDFAEAYLVDLPTPVKHLPGVYEAYKAAELRMDALIYERFGLAYSEQRHSAMWKFGLMVVGWADMYALLVEAYHFMPSRGLTWGIPLERPSLNQIYQFRWPVDNIQAYEELEERFYELKPEPPTY